MAIVGDIVRDIVNGPFEWIRLRKPGRG